MKIRNSKGLIAASGLLALSLSAFAADKVVSAASTVSPASPTSATEAADSPKLYTMDCGTIDVKDMKDFSDTGELDGKSGKVVDPCYVIRHPKGILVWDTGLGDALAAQPNGADSGVFHMAVKTTLVDQLKSIGIAPADVTYLAFSHMHFDHTGNANLFPSATWILNKAELAWADSKPTPEPVNLDSISGVKTVKTDMIGGDKDVFGDGTVRILLAPGHTPGHSVLMLKLKKAGTVVLSGDLYHTVDNFHAHRQPVFNTSRAETLASFNRIDTIVKNTHARFIIQHAPEDFAKMPKLPAALE